jgi:predicted transcriptional regulator
MRFGTRDMSKFFELYRKRGTLITLDILSKDHEMPQSEFLKELRKDENVLNAYFRVRKDLLDYQIIAFKLDNSTTEKVIYLTEKGKIIQNHLTEIEGELKKGEIEYGIRKKQTNPKSNILDD